MLVFVLVSLGRCFFMFVLVLFLFFILCLFPRMCSVFVYVCVCIGARGFPRQYHCEHSFKVAGEQYIIENQTEAINGCKVGKIDAS